MKNMQAIMREVLTAHRDNMCESNIELLGLADTARYAEMRLRLARKWHDSEKRKAAKMAKATADWHDARDAHKAAYLIHDRNYSDAKKMIAEFERDVKTLESRMNPTAAKYSAHYWNVDVDVYIYDDTDISDAEIKAYAAAIMKCLRGEFAITNDGTPGDRGFSFWADDADQSELDDLLSGLEKRGCVIEYPDWDELNGTAE